MELYFISSNEHKRREVLKLLASERITIHPVESKLEEIQSEDMAKIAEDKALRAFKQIWRPVLVEQTGLLLKSFDGLPGGFTEIFWDTLGVERFSRFFSALDSAETTARSVFAYCDGRTVRVFQGEIRGRIVDRPRGERGFGWDCVFVPEGYGRTFAEMSQEEKDGASMRRAALEQVREYLEGMEHGSAG